LKSEYPEAVHSIDLEYPMGPTTGYLTKKFNDEETFNAIDVNKAYTHCLKNINYVPVFSYFDRYQTYDNHAIEDLTLYCVEVDATDFATTILFPLDHTRCFGYQLKYAQTNHILFQIKYFRRPSNIEQVNFKDPIEQLYNNNDLSMCHKKHIVNKTTGLVEKKYNSAHLCKVFSSFTEAQFYQIKYGGRIFSLQEDTYASCNTPEEDISIEEYLAKYGSFEVEYTAGASIHILVIDKKETLVNGFRYIKELIYNNMSMFMFSLFNRVVAAGIIPKGIKTDAILVSETQSELEKHFSFNANEIGGIKFETNKTCVNNPVVQKSNFSFNIPQLKVNHIEIQNEYDTNEFKQVFDKHNRVLLQGLYPGVGKSTAISNYTGHSILFVTPFNKLAQQTRVKGAADAITINMLLGIYGDGHEYVKITPYDVSKYDCICFDEILINPPKILQKIDIFMNKYTDKKFFATGDVDQLQPIDFQANNINNVSSYLIDCVSHMFPNQITLKINKRLQTDKQRHKLAQLKQELFNPSLDMLQTLKNHGFSVIHNFSQLTTTQNICYFNFRAQQVNKHVHEALVTPPKNAIKIHKTLYWPGLEITCKEHYKKDGRRLFTNYTYQILTINKKQFSIKDIVEETTFTFDISMLAHFQLPYAYTCHSVQGLSLSGPITIFDGNTPHVYKYYVWRAITRATDFNQITIYQHSQSEIDSLLLNFFLTR